MAIDNNLLDIKIKSIDVKKWRKLNDINIPIGNRITVISGLNGVGKSNLLALLSSSSGAKGYKHKPTGGRSFHPEFYTYFKISEEELDSNYFCINNFLAKEDSAKYNITFHKRLRIKNDINEGRDIRIIPTTYRSIDEDNNDSDEEKIAIKLYQTTLRDELNIGPEARVPIPTIHLSLSRLMPLAESNPKHKNLNKNSRFFKDEASEKYVNWYNTVLPDSISDKDTAGIISKEKTSSFYVPIDSTTPFTQSIGQDSLGTIISTLVDFYLISKEPNYVGGIICIDEIDVSLHPIAQVSLLNLLDKVSRELNLQIIVTSHSLTIIKEILKRAEKNKDDYILNYLKNSKCPYLMKKPTYKKIKADMFQDLKGAPKPKVKVYFEDSVGMKTFNILLNVYNKLEERKLNILEDIKQIESELGCDILLNLMEKDKYYENIIIIYDGDVRIDKKNRKNGKEGTLSSNLKDYKFKFEIGDFNLKKVKGNMIFLPTIFSPEFYLFRIIYTYVINEHDHMEFWRNLENIPDYELYTPEMIKNNYSHVFNSDSWNPDTFKKSKISKFIFDFCENSGILEDYYMNNPEDLYDFWNKFIQSFTKLKNKNYSTFFD